ncbi:hypothetical protein [Streptomyces luteireticuli]|uniref:hypothetical protein n=1 Tax=Streptomyces luteireticuli TaxID=173858 RepID=UPI003556F7F8
MASDSRISVTIVYGKRHHDSEATFQGSQREVFQGIAAFFGLDRETLTGVTLGELVVEATALAQGATCIARGLDAHVVAQPTALPAASADGPAGLLDRIAECSSVRELHELWAAHQAAFGDPAALDAWKARGRALAA